MHEPVSDIDTVVVDSLKALDPKRPIKSANKRLMHRRNSISIRSPRLREQPTPLGRAGELDELFS